MNHTYAKERHSSLRLLVVVDCAANVAVLFTEYCYTNSWFCVKFQIIFILFKYYIHVNWYFSRYSYIFWRKLNLVKVKIMLKLFPPTLRSQTLGIDVHLCSLLTAGLGGDEWLIWSTFWFTPWVGYPGTLSGVGWAGFRASLGVWDPACNRTPERPALGQVTLSTTLFGIYNLCVKLWNSRGNYSFFIFFSQLLFFIHQYFLSLNPHALLSDLWNGKAVH
jgi:hypothetical protein